jgi:hypothetical protein
MTTVYDCPIKSSQEAEQVVKDVVKLNDQLVEIIEAGKNTVDFLPMASLSPLHATKMARKPPQSCGEHVQAARG